MWQTSSSSVRPTAGSFQSMVRIRRENIRRTGPKASPQLGQYDTVALRDEGSEWAVVQRAIAGSASAQEQLFAYHGDRLYRTAFSIVRNKEDAEDALQDGLFKAFTSLPSFQGQSCFSTWLTRIVINAALMIRRRKSAHPECSLEETLDDQPRQLLNRLVDKRRDPETTCADTETDTLVEEHVGQLSPMLQTAFCLRAIEGFSIQESSHELGIPRTTLKSRFFRARHKLALGLRAAFEKKTSARSSADNKAVQ